LINKININILGKKELLIYEFHAQFTQAIRSHYLYSRQQNEPNNQQVELTFHFFTTLDIQQKLSLVLPDSFIITLISHAAPPGEWPINQQRE